MSTFHPGFPSHRRSFLGQIATSAAAVAAASLLPVGDARAASAMPGAAEGDEPWLKGYTGKHKVIYDAPELNGGFPLIFALTYINTMTQTYTLKPGDTSVVIVMRHMGIAAAFTDAIWAKYKFGEMFTVTDPETKKPALRNIFVKSHPGDIMLTDASADKLITKGVRICVCNVALGVLSGKAAAAMNMKPEDAAKEWTAGVIPGAFIVPSGVLAVARSQEAGGSYCFAG